MIGPDSARVIAPMGKATNATNSDAEVSEVAESALVLRTRPNAGPRRC